MYSTVIKIHVSPIDSGLFTPSRPSSMSVKRDKKMMGAFKNLTIQIVDLNQDGAS